MHFVANSLIALKIFTFVLKIFQWLIPLPMAAQNVRRRLFNDEEDNSEQNQHNGNEEQTKSASDGVIDLRNKKKLEEARLKWNFDFDNEVPLPGDWEWEKVSPETVTENSECINAEENKENRSV